MLTPKQWHERSLSVIEVIERRLDNGEQIPTIEDIGEQLGMSKATVFEALSHMKREGLVTWNKNKARTLCITKAGDELFESSLHVRS